MERHFIHSKSYNLLKKVTPNNTFRVTESDMKDIPIQIDFYDYMEQIIKQIVEEMKQKGYLGEEFMFFTRAEQKAEFEEHINQFLKAP